jgi:hypothetical protein
MELANGADLEAYPATAQPVAVAQPEVAAPTPAAVVAPGAVAPTNYTVLRTEALRQQLAAESARLNQLLAPEWQTFLALPASTGNPALRPNPAELAAVYARYQQVTAAPQYAALVARPEFQSTMELLRDYAAAVQASSATLQLPSPPALVDPRR